MTLFSWFIDCKKQGRAKTKKVVSFEQEVAIFKKNSIWPIAKVNQSTSANLRNFSCNSVKKESRLALLVLKEKHIT